MRLLLAFAAAVVLSACGSSAAESPLTVEQALAAGSGKPVRVHGALIAAGGTVRLCSAVLESYPPQCGGPALLVEGLDLFQLEGLQRASGVTWSDREVELVGTVADGSLTVS